MDKSNHATDTVRERPAANEREWLFVLANKGTNLTGWWLKLASQQELDGYLSLTSSRYADAFQDWLHDGQHETKEPAEDYWKRANLVLAAYALAENTRQDAASAIIQLQIKTAASMSAALAESGCVYVNPRGGWCVSQQESGSFCRRKSLVWPDFDESQIRISRFPGGTHYYAYIGDVQVRSGDALKFDAYGEAYAAAKNYIAR